MFAPQCDHVTYERAASREGITYAIRVCKLCGHWSTHLVEVSYLYNPHRGLPLTSAKRQGALPKGAR